MAVKTFDEARHDREEYTKRAAADAMLPRVIPRRGHRPVIAHMSGISPTYFSRLLRADAQMSLFIFLELSAPLRFEDPCEFLRDVLVRREQLMSFDTRGDSRRKYSVTR